MAAAQFLIGVVARVLWAAALIGGGVDESRSGPWWASKEHQENHFYSQADLNHLITPMLLREASVCPGVPCRVLEIVNLCQGTAGPSVYPHNFT